MKEKSLQELEDLAAHLRNEVVRLNNLQQAIKIQINSFYGSIANASSAFCDWRISSAITLTGQLAIKWIETRVNEFLNSFFKTKDVSYVIAGDTDSIYVDLSAFVEKVGITETEKAVEYLDKVSKQLIQPVIQKAFMELGRKMNAFEPEALIMKRDVISDKAIWRAKKGYAMRVWDVEGVRFKEPEMKVMGLEVIKAVIPQVARDGMKKAITFILDGKQDELQKYIEEFRQSFESLPWEERAFPRGCKGLEKYHDPLNIWRTGTPMHVKGSLVYNYLLKKKGIDLPPIHSGDKVKYLPLKTPNYLRSNVISFHDKLPKELGLHGLIDGEELFRKTFLEPVESLLGLLGWHSEKKLTLDDLFG